LGVKGNIFRAAIAAVAWTMLGAARLMAQGTAPSPPAADRALSEAICPIVYPGDQIASAKGFHYLFYGNGFFINDQGYLITAAHVLSQLHGGQPHILLQPITGPPKLLPAVLIAADREHDIAILRATPNPFESNYKVGFLRLEERWVARGHAVLAGSVHPSKPLDAYTLDGSVENRTSGEVFAFPFSQLEKQSSETELFLFNHQVRRGQSGAPVISPESDAVVGLIEGQWLRSTLVSLTAASDQAAPGVGAAVPIHYAIALLQQRGIVWHTVSGGPGPTDNAANSAEGFSPPAPVSLVGSPFPSQALFGGEVVFDALLDNRARLIQIKVVRGEAPFLDQAFATVRTWTFVPAREDAKPVASRIGIVFMFSQTYDPPRKAAMHKYDEPLAKATDRGAVPMATIEPQYPAPRSEDGSVILNVRVAADGKLSSVQKLSGDESLAEAARAAVEQWSFAPGTRESKEADSAAIVVVVFRHAGASHPVARNN
jgi:TonB family protein